MFLGDRLLHERGHGNSVPRSCRKSRHERKGVPRGVAELAAHRRSDPVALFVVRNDDREVGEPCRAGRRRRRAPALPRVRAQMMVVAARAQECGLVAELRHQVESHHVAVEPDALLDVGDAQVDMAHSGARGQDRRRLGVGGEQVVDVERPGADPVCLPVPEPPWPVGVDLDPVVVGVAQIERLADEVVGRAGQLNAVGDGVLHPPGEVATLGHEQGEVEEAGVAVGRTGAGLLDEVEELHAVGRAKPGLAAAHPEHVETDRLDVVGQRPREVRHGEVDGADGGGRGDRHRQEHA